MSRQEQTPPAELTQLLLQAALTYARNGWSVFPLQGKIPFKGSQGVKDATIDAHRIRTWWTQHPTANIGLATGARSGVIVLDIDPRHKGHLSIKALEKRYELLPKTRTSRTAHGGYIGFTSIRKMETTTQTLSHLTDSKDWMSEAMEGMLCCRHQNSMEDFPIFGETLIFRLH